MNALLQNVVDGATLDAEESARAFDAIMTGEDPRRIAQDWQDALDGFMRLREKYLIYK